jgi:hypothetical protein
MTANLIQITGFMSGNGVVCIFISTLTHGQDQPEMDQKTCSNAGSRVKHHRKLMLIFC